MAAKVSHSTRLSRKKDIQCLDGNFTNLCSDKSPGSHIFFLKTFSLKGSGRLPNDFSSVDHLVFFSLFQTVYQVSYKSLESCKIDTLSIMKSDI